MSNPTHFPQPWPHPPPTRAAHGHGQGTPVTPATWNQSQMYFDHNGMAYVPVYPSGNMDQRLHHANHSASQTSSFSTGSHPQPVQVSSARPPRPFSEPSPRSQASNVLPEVFSDYRWGYVCGQLKEMKDRQDMQTFDVSYRSPDGTTSFNYKGPFLNDVTDAMFKIKDQDHRHHKENHGVQSSAGNTTQPITAPQLQVTSDSGIHSTDPVDQTTAT